MGLIPNPGLEGNVFPLDCEGCAARHWAMEPVVAVVNEFRAVFLGEPVEVEKSC